MIIEINTPLMEGIADAEVEIDTKKLKFKYKDIYLLNIDLPMEINRDSTKAKFEKAKKILTLSADIVHKQQKMPEKKIDENMEIINEEEEKRKEEEKKKKEEEERIKKEMEEKKRKEEEEIKKKEEEMRIKKEKERIEKEKKEKERIEKEKKEKELREKEQIEKNKEETVFIRGQKVNNENLLSTNKNALKEIKYKQENDNHSNQNKKLIEEIIPEVKEEQNEEEYEEIREDLAVVKKKMDYYLACQYCGQILDGADFREVLLADNLDFFKRDEYQRLFESAEEHKFFHWAVEFPAVYISGGVEIMIGHPPYGANLSEEIKTFFKTIYEIVHMRTPDTFNYFIAKSFDLLNDEGEVSFIVPSNLLFQNEYEKTRKFLVSKHGLRRVINAGDSVFARASVPTCVFIAKNTGSDSYEILYSDMRGGYKDSTEWNKGNITINSSSVLATPSCVIGVSEESSSILDKIKDNSLTIDELAEEVAAGISTGGNEAFCITEEDIKNESLESGLIYKMLGGRNIDAYSIRWSDEYIIYSTKNSNTPQYINTYKRLERFKEKLSKKRETKKGMLPWWSLHWPRNPDLFMGKKIIMRQTSDRIRATIDENNYYILNSILILKLKEGCEFSYEYVLGILNSALNNFVYRNLTQEKGRAFAEVKPKNIRKLYIPNMEQEYRDKIEMCVKRIMANENAEENKKTIDDMIYSFYSITEEEINVINKEVG